jgi:hypothetical protein
MQVPFIGVASITDGADAEALVDCFPGRTAWKFQCGVQVSSNTLHGRPSSQPNRVPPIEMIPQIFLDDPRALNIVHFYSHTPADTIGYRRDLQLVMEAAGPNCHGIQLNNRWISPSLIEGFYEEFPEKKIVIQIDEEACREMRYDISAVAQRIADWYGGAIDYAFFDWSRGFGKEIDTKRLLPYLEALSARMTAIGLVVAGGLHAQVVERLRPLLNRFPTLSWDAQKNLRTPEDHLDLKAAKEFVLESLVLTEQMEMRRRR